MNRAKTVGIVFVIALIIGFILSLLKIKQSPVLTGTVIILNGPSSVGKSSIIKAFQKLNSTPWLSIGIDNFFVGVLPPKFYLEDTEAHHAVMQGIASIDGQSNKVFTLKVGSEGQKVIKGMHRAIAAYAHTGNNVIVDYINYEPAWGKDLINVLSDINTVWIGVCARLETIEQREKQRATSPLGHARSHYAAVHQGLKYDLNLDTDILTSEQSAQLISNKIKESIKHKSL